MASPDRNRFLQEDEFLGQFVKSFAQPVNIGRSPMHYPSLMLTYGVPAV